MKWEIYYAPEDFVLNQYSCSRLPFVLSDDGVSHRQLNRFIRRKALVERRDIEITVTESVRRIVKYLNFLAAGADKLPYRRKRYEYYESTDSLIWSFRQSISSCCSAVTRNQYLSSVYTFLWFCEQDESDSYCKGVIGVTDSDRGIGKFPVSVEPSRKRNRQYTIPIMERVVGGTKTGGRVGDFEWDNAYIRAASGTSEECQRDFLMIRIIRKTGLRRIAVANLKLEEFLVEVSPSEQASGAKFVWIDKEKNSKSHNQRFSVDLFLEVQDYIKQVRPLLLKDGDKGNPFIFNGKKSGKPISRRQINNRLSIYGITPHSGRGIRLTELFIERLKQGYDERDATFLVAQEANHSLKSDGQTLRKHYLEAEMIFRGTNSSPLIKEEAEILKLKNRIRELESEGGDEA